MKARVVGTVLTHMVSFDAVLYVYSENDDDDDVTRLEGSVPLYACGPQSEPGGSETSCVSCWVSSYAINC